MWQIPLRTGGTRLLVAQCMYRVYHCLITVTRPVGHTVQRALVLHFCQFHNLNLIFLEPEPEPVEEAKPVGKYPCYTIIRNTLGDTLRTSRMEVVSFSTVADWSIRHREKSRVSAMLLHTLPVKYILRSLRSWSRRKLKSSRRCWHLWWRHRTHATYW